MCTIKSKQRRASQVNKVIQIISEHGRRFFYDNTHNRVAYIQVDERGTVWFVDDYTGKRVNTHKPSHSRVWQQFSHGGTLKILVEAFRDFICTGETVSPHQLGSESPWTAGNVWGYEPEAMAIVRQQAGVSRVFKQPEEQGNE